MSNDIQIAIDKIKTEAEVAQVFINYYDGNHSLAFASEKYQNTFGNILKSMRENLCQIVVDAPADRMEIINFSGGDDKPKMDDAWQIWQDAQMELYSHDLHIETLKTGDGYVIVERGVDGEPKIYVQDSRQCTVIYDENTGVALFGAKMWTQTDKKIRLTMYYPDRIEKFITANKGTGTLKEASFIPFESDTEENISENVSGVIPMFHFRTASVLPNAIPMQDRLNKTICDELVAQEFAAYPQRWATGLEVPTNEITGKSELPFKAGVDRLWFTSGDGKDTKFGEFGAADLGHFIEVEDAARLSVARVTGTPLHFFSFTTSDALSGEALKTLESRFTKRVKRTTLSFSPVWAAVMNYALQITGKVSDVALTVQWESPEQRSEKEMLETLDMKRETLDVPVDTLREEFGYSVEDIAKFNEVAAALPVIDPSLKKAAILPNDNEKTKQIKAIA